MIYTFLIKNYNYIMSKIKSFEKFNENSEWEHEEGETTDIYISYLMELEEKVEKYDNLKLKVKEFLSIEDSSKKEELKEEILGLL